MGTLIRLLCDHLEAHGVSRFRAGDVDIELRGRCVHIQDNSVMLGPTALALFKKLAATGSVVSREELVSCLAEGPDDHALEVALSRLRRALGVPSLITAVVKRGYRLNAVRLD